jgi:U3 small nucleolar RNA-associated protein 5
MSTKRKLPSKLSAPKVTTSARTPSKQILAEARAVVTSGAAIESPSVQINGHKNNDVASEDEEDDDEELDDEALEGEDLSEDEEDEKNFHAEGEAEDVDMEDAAQQDEEEEEDNANPSFGDLVLAHTSGPIDVSSAFPTEAPAKASALAAPTGASLGVALTQALKTNDSALLESCLQTSDLDTIRATIQRLAPPLAGTLLTTLASRLHRRPGRAGSLMVWIQWTLVTHGGFLATQPGVVAKLAELNRVVEERAKGLQGLLQLKGKLDLLDAQMQLRRALREGRREEVEDEEDAVIYVEGQESEDEQVAANTKANGVKSRRRRHGDDDEDSEMSDDDMPDTLGDRVIADSDDEEDEDSDHDEGLLDDEAEESENDTDAEVAGEDVDFDDMDEEEEESDAEEPKATPARTPKVGKARGMFGKRA